jgi:hypothetical protein
MRQLTFLVVAEMRFAATDYKTARVVSVEFDVANLRDEGWEGAC